MYAKDETINNVLELQFPSRHAHRDASVDFAAKNNGRAPNKEEMKKLESDVEKIARKEGEASMGRLGSYFEKTYTGGTEKFGDTIIGLTQGVDEEKATALVARGGFLEDWQVLEYATKGAGTDEDEFKRVLKKQKTKADQDALQTKWQQMTGTHQTIKDLIHDETSGRLENDLVVDNEYGGEPEDPAVMVAKAKAQLDFEHRSGGESTYVDEFGEQHTVKNHEYVVLEKRLEQLKEAAEARKEAEHYPEDDPRKIWAQAQLDQGALAFTSGVETHRFLVDQRTELAAQVVTMAVTIVAAVVITVATGGVGSVAGAALIAGAASLFGAAAGIATKMSMKGAAYGTDELGVDIALGVVDAVVSAATAGVGGKLLKGATAAAKAAGTTGRGVVVAIGRMAEGTRPQARRGTRDHRGRRGVPAVAAHRGPGHGAEREDVDRGQPTAEHARRGRDGCRHGHFRQRRDRRLDQPARSEGRERAGAGQHPGNPGPTGRPGPRHRRTRAPRGPVLRGESQPDAGGLPARSRRPGHAAGQVQPRGQGATGVAPAGEHLRSSSRGPEVRRRRQPRRDVGRQAVRGVHREPDGPGVRDDQGRPTDGDRQAGRRPARDRPGGVPPAAGRGLEDQTPRSRGSTSR